MIRSVHSHAPEELHTSKDSAKSRSLDLMDAILVLLPVCAFILWFTSLKGVNVAKMTDIGLASVFPPLLIIALFLMNVSYCLALQKKRMRIILLLLHFGFILFMLYGISPLVEQAPRFSIVYRHAGYTEYIMRTGTVDPNLDAYFNWPGFFTLSAFLTRIAGYQDILAYASWSPVFYNLIYLGPMYMIFDSFTRNKRIVWLSLWFFCLTNWIAQDYFSPQGLNFFLYLVIIAILVKWFKGSPTVQLHLPRWVHRIRFVPQVVAWIKAPEEIPNTPGSKQQRIALIACIIIISAFSISSHQLTPFFTLLSVGALVIFRRCTLWWLPIVLAVMTGAWILIMAQTYLSGHLDVVLGGFGHIGSSFSANVTSRVVGNPGHTFIARMRIIMTVFVWGLAFVGGLLRLLKGHRDVSIVLLALAPFPLFIIQPYGGEMLLRTYMFALPAMVFLAASLFYTLPTSIFRKALNLPRWKTVAIVGISVVLLGGFLFTRYGNERNDYMTYDEVNGMRYLYSNAPAGSVFLESWDGAPLQFQDYEKYVLYSASDVLPDAIAENNLPAIIRFMAAQKGPRAKAYLIFTRSQEATFESTSGISPGLLKQIESEVQASGQFDIVYTNPDVQIFELVDVG